MTISEPQHRPHWFLLSNISVSQAPDELGPQLVSVSLDSGGVLAAAGDYRDTVPLYADLNYTVRFVVQLDASHKAGAKGAIGTQSKTKHALRKGKLQRQGSLLLQGMDIDEDSDKTVGEQLREALSKAAVRVIDLFREWDLNGDGKIDRKEWSQAIPLIGVRTTSEHIDRCADSHPAAPLAARTRCPTRTTPLRPVADPLCVRLTRTQSVR